MHASGRQFSIMSSPCKMESQKQLAFSIQEPQRHLSQIEFIKTTHKQLKVMRGKQKQEIKKSMEQKQMSLADTLNHLEVQSQLIRKEFRRREQRRFSSITFDQNTQQGNTYYPKSSAHKSDSIERQSSVAQYIKYQTLAEQILGNTQPKGFQIDQFQTELNEQPQQQLLHLLTPGNQSVKISSKHNLFRAKPTKNFLMGKYERRLPKSSCQELSIKTYFN